MKGELKKLGGRLLMADELEAFGIRLSRSFLIMHPGKDRKYLLDLLFEDIPEPKRIISLGLAELNSMEEAHLDLCVQNIIETAKRGVFVGVGINSSKLAVDFYPNYIYNAIIRILEHAERPLAEPTGKIMRRAMKEKGIFCRCFRRLISKLFECPYDPYDYLVIVFFAENFLEVDYVLAKRVGEVLVL